MSVWHLFRINILKVFIKYIPYSYIANDSFLVLLTIWLKSYPLATPYFFIVDTSGLEDTSLGHFFLNYDFRIFMSYFRQRKQVLEAEFFSVN